MKFWGSILVFLCATLFGCAGVFLRTHITNIDISPRTLPPEGGEVKIIVKTYNADHVWVSFKRTSDGKTFKTSLSMEFWLGMLSGEQKWDGEIYLPPNNDPEGKDQVYVVTVKAWDDEGWDHVREGGKVIVKGKSDSPAPAEPQ